MGAFSAVGDAVSSAADRRRRRACARASAVSTWVFDLDNTLYPSDSGIWPLIDERITLFLIDLFGLDGQSARALHRDHRHRHGTRCAVSSRRTSIEADRFLEFVTISTARR